MRSHQVVVRDFLKRQRALIEDRRVGYLFVWDAFILVVDAKYERIVGDGNYLIGSIHYR